MTKLLAQRLLVAGKLTKLYRILQQGQLNWFDPEQRLGLEQAITAAESFEADVADGSVLPDVVAPNTVIPGAMDDDLEDPELAEAEESLEYFLAA